MFSPVLGRVTSAEGALLPARGQGKVCQTRQAQTCPRRAEEKQEGTPGNSNPTSKCSEAKLARGWELLE